MSSKIVLMVDVEPEHAEFVRSVLAVVRSGLYDSAVIAEPSYVIGWEGPFEVDSIDEEILDSMAAHYEGHDQGAKSDDEPDIVRGRGIRAGSRAIAAQVLGLTVAGARS